jgi:hypothetical protein
MQSQCEITVNKYWNTHVIEIFAFRKYEYHVHNFICQSFRVCHVVSPDMVTSSYLSALLHRREPMKKRAVLCRCLLLTCGSTITKTIALLHLSAVPNWVAGSTASIR